MGGPSVADLPECLRTREVEFLARLRITPLRLGLLVAGLYCFSLALSFFQGSAFARGSLDIGFVTQTSGTRTIPSFSLLFAFVVAPLALGFGHRYLLHWRLTLLRLRESGPLLVPEAEYAEFLERTGRLLRHPIARLVLAAVVLGATVFAAVERSLPGSRPIWFHFGRGPAGYFDLALALPAWYLVGSVFWNAVVMTTAFRRLFRGFEVRVTVVHPDGCGGLSRIGSAALAFTLFLAACALGLAAILMQAILGGVRVGVHLYLCVVAYLALAIWGFFGSLGSAHARMKAAKEEFLRQTGRRANELVDRLRTELTSGREIGPRSTELGAIMELYRIAEKMPVWPFNAASVGKFAGTVVAPLLTPFLAALIRFWLVRPPS